MKILLFAGQAQHGKDTSVTILSDHYKRQGLKVKTLRYGDYLKFIAREHFGWDGNKDVAGRTLLQTLGTEKARTNNINIWVNVVIETVKAIYADYDYILIPDFRYPNEHEQWLLEPYEVKTFWIHRKDFDNRLTEEQKNHPSETSLLDFPFDYMISVESKIYKLRDALIGIIERDKI